jgi:hypothetical protein
MVRSGELTERGAARITGVSQPHLHNVLKGARVLSPGLADQVLRSLKLCLFDLLEPQELEACGARSSVLQRAVPVFEGRLGPGEPFPSSESAWKPFPFLPSELESLGDPVLVELADDPLLRPQFRAGDTVLLDRSRNRRRHLDGHGCYAVDLGAESLVRRLRREGDCLYLLAPAAPVSGPGGFISLANRNILEVVRAKIVWIGRNLEPPPIAQKPFFQEPAVQAG